MIYPDFSVLTLVPGRKSLVPYQYQLTTRLEMSIILDSLRIEEEIDMDIQIGTSVQVKVVKQPTNEAAIKTLRRVLSKDETIKEEKNAREMQEKLDAAADKFSGFNSRNKGSAMSAMARAAETMERQCIIMVFGPWKKEARCEKMKRYGK